MERLWSRRAGGSNCNRRPRDGAEERGIRREGGFTLVELLICILILTTGMLAIAGLLGVTTQMHIGAREAARATRLAQDKIDDLMKLNFASAAAVQVGGSLTANVANYFEQPTDGVTVRWAVAAGPNAIPDLRVVTVRVVNLRSQQYGRQTDISTVIRQW